MPLQVQIPILSVDTGNFYSNKESYLHWLNHKVKIERYELKKEEKNISDKLKKYGITDDELLLIYKGSYDYSQLDDNKFIDNIYNLSNQYCIIKDLIAIKSKKIKNIKDRLLKLLSNKVQKNIDSNGKHHVRVLRNINYLANKKKDILNKIDVPLYENNTIQVFDSFFTRTIGARQNELCEDFMVVQIYYFDIAEDIIYHGFTYKGEKYIYFTSSAGQIRTKKTVFVKESVWNKYNKTIMCGLTLDKINEKGGNNPNKHLAYLALANSATDEWKEFNIDKSIVIDDFETDVYGTYDLVDDVNYSITRTTGNVPIPHTDGCGMMLPCMGKNRMVRLPWMKGLLGVFDFVKFIQVNNCSPIIKDIYGVEHNIIDEDIQILFTKSQFKSYKYYDSWEQYKEYYKKYNCTAGYTNLEEDRIKDATINYQMLQSLTDITEEEIKSIAKPSIDKLNNLCSSVDSIKNIFGITPYNLNKTYLQKGIELYPELINDIFIKTKLRELKDSLIKKYKSGKLQVNGKYTFLLPDLYAACEYWFMGIENPKGLLDDKEVFCWLFRKNEKLDCLRSPHLYREHAIRNNMASNDCEKQELIRKWFTTDALYTSCHDLISKILQFDVDGDKGLIVADKNIISVAERNLKNIVPLYYNMKKAYPCILNNKTIYSGLNAAFVNGNIGQYSNNISKIWNSEEFISGTDEEKENVLNVIKLLCMENNFCIDEAKTLYMPKRPDFASDLINQYTNKNLPYFFKYAKDKDDNQIEDENGSFVNKLNYIIPNVRINCRKLNIGDVDYKLLMSNPDIECNVAFNKNGKIEPNNTNPIILKYIELSKKYFFKIDVLSIKDKSSEILKESQIRYNLLYNKIINEVKTELSKFNYTEIEITDILVKYLYGIKNSKYKNLLWVCYGNYIIDNLNNNGCKIPYKETQCIDCGEWFKTSSKDNCGCRCSKCKAEYRRKYNAEKQKMYRKQKRVQTK